MSHPELGELSRCETQGAPPSAKLGLQPEFRTSGLRIWRWNLTAHSWFFFFFLSKSRNVNEYFEIKFLIAQSLKTVLSNPLECWLVMRLEYELRVLFSDLLP